MGKILCFDPQWMVSFMSSRYLFYSKNYSRILKPAGMGITPNDAHIKPSRKNNSQFSSDEKADAIISCLNRTQ